MPYASYDLISSNDDERRKCQRGFIDFINNVHLPGSSQYVHCSTERRKHDGKNPVDVEQWFSDKQLVQLLKASTTDFYRPISWHMRDKKAEHVKMVNSVDKEAVVAFLVQCAVGL